MTPGSHGIFWPGPDDSAFRCECGAVEDFDVEFCRHDACPMCREASECCVECVRCHRLTDEHEHGVCVACVVAEADRKEARRERWAAYLEAKGDEMREARR